MKSRIVFLCTLAAFLNPIAVMAAENNKVADCWKYADATVKKNEQMLKDGTAEVVDGRIVKKAKTSSNGG